MEEGKRAGARRPGAADDAVILEFTPIGAAVRVAAIDPRTLIEVVIQGPAAAGEAALREVALRKLAHALERHRSRR